MSSKSTGLPTAALVLGGGVGGVEFLPTALSSANLWDGSGYGAFRGADQLAVCPSKNCIISVITQKN